MRRRRVWQSRLLIVVAGVSLGYAARWILGAPESGEAIPSRAFVEPLEEISIEDLPLLPVDGEFDLDVPIYVP